MNPSHLAVEASVVLVGAWTGGTIGWLASRWDYRWPEDRGATRSDVVMGRHVRGWVLWMVLAVPAVWLLLGVTQPTPSRVLAALAAVPCLVLWRIDLEHHRLPDVLVLPTTAVAFFLALLLSAELERWPALGWALGLGVGMAALLLTLSLAVGGVGLGLGDIKLAVLTVGVPAWAAPERGLTSLLLALVIGGFYASVAMLAGRLTPRQHLAFGPFLVVGMVVACIGA